MIKRLPSWFRQEFPKPEILETARFFSEFRVHTVCQEAHCPNITNCFSCGRFAFMILGNFCARACRFCAVQSRFSPLPVDPEEPKRIRDLVEKFKLSYVVITSVSRDDLADGGAGQFARAVELIHGLRKGIKVELLIPDFQAKMSSLRVVLSACPEVVAHNIETVFSLYSELRPQAFYQRSLEVLRSIKKLAPRVITKSSLMLGLGEKKEEILAAMRDLRGAGCDVLTLGQYLAPSINHYPVKQLVKPRIFRHYQKKGLEMGFRAVLSGPLVRSSYMAEELYKIINLKSETLNSKQTQNLKLKTQSIF